MCGRFIQSARAGDYARIFGATTDPGTDALPPRFNVAPSQPVLIVRETDPGRRTIAAVRWGLVPSWSRGPDARYSMINARAETVHRKPAYRGPFRYRRCLIPAEGFYEWRQSGSAKQPYCIRPEDSEAPLAFAGLWDLWTGPQGEELESCTIIVRAAEGPVAHVHDRMPVVLDEKAWDLWLDPSVQRAEAVLPVLDMRDARGLSVYAVSRRVNSPVNEGPDLMAPEDESGAASLS